MNSHDFTLFRATLCLLAAGGGPVSINYLRLMGRGYSVGHVVSCEI
jgi:hypothetical protein